VNRIAKVGQLDDTVGKEQQIGRFDVHVDDGLRVQKLQSASGEAEHGGRFALVECTNR
jgi:hypothetical protein